MAIDAVGAVGAVRGCSGHNEDTKVTTQETESKNY